MEKLITLITEYGELEQQVGYARATHSAKLEETQEQRLEKFIEIQKELIRLSKELLK